MNNILQRVVLTEKASSAVSGARYTFYVHPEANKIQIKQAVEQSFDVKVATINTIKIPGKKRRRGRIVGRTSDRKKAVITLMPGQNDDALKALF